MLTDKQVKKFTPIMHNFLNGNNPDFNMAIRKLTKLELMLLTTCSYEVMYLGKHKKLHLEEKIIYALETK